MSRQSVQEPECKSLTSPRLMALLASFMMPEKPGERDGTFILTGKS